MVSGWSLLGLYVKMFLMTFVVMIGAMDEIYSVLVTMTYPDAITNGLRRQTDLARGIIEKTQTTLSRKRSKVTGDQVVFAHLQRISPDQIWAA